MDDDAEIVAEMDRIAAVRAAELADAQRQDAEDACLIATRCEVLRQELGGSRVDLGFHGPVGTDWYRIHMRPDGLPILTDEIRKALREAKPWT